jgi:8-oxo-dGTP pyrophosphatase MutT (NUDIX family)
VKDGTASQPDRAEIVARLNGSLARLTAPLDEDGAWHRRRERSLRGDFQMDPLSTIKPKLRPAAVLVPLIAHRDTVSVMLTQRTEHLNAHAGQISFPGGRIEDDDENAVAAALREAHEEVGLPPERVEVIGRLDDYVTGTGFVVAPVVGIIEPPYPVDPDPFEVADVFEVPLAFLLNPANHHRHSKTFNGRERHFYAMPYGERYIWGATAAMIVNLYDALTAPPLGAPSAIDTAVEETRD